MVITNHAKDRLKERAGCKKSYMEKNASKALSGGVKHSDTTGSLHKYITWLYFQHKTANNVRVYNDLVYIFNNTTLITVLPLSHRYRAAYHKLRKRGRKDG